MIPYGRQDISETDIEAVVEVLRSDFITQGPVVPRFEQAVASLCGAKHAIAVSSATAALHIACLSLGVSNGDIVWTSPITFVASANCALYCGAQIDFIDIDSETSNISVSALEERLLAAERDGLLPKVVIPVHFAGLSCDMQSIAGLARRFNFKIIEDASHAIGGKYLEEPIGSGRFSDITVFSFHPVKVITTGEGGMLLTNSGQLEAKLRLIRSHGITRDEKLMTGKSEGPWYYQQIDLGFNYRMTDLQAALGLSQLERLDEFVRRRHEIATYYDNKLSELPLKILARNHDSHSALHLYVVRLQPQRVRRSHREIFESLRNSGIGVNLHYIPVYLQPYYAKLGFAPGYCPKAEEYYSEAISLPMYPAMTQDQQDEVVKVLREALYE